MNKNEAMEFLKSFINRVDTQDNRATAKPVQFLLQVERTIYGEELSNPDVTKYSLPEYDFYDFDSKEELIKCMKENGWEDEDIEKQRDQIVLYQGQHYWDTQQVFLTEEGVKEHIQLNGHNLRRHRDYVVHSFRNPELQELYQAIREVIK